MCEGVVNFCVFSDLLTFSALHLDTMGKISYMRETRDLTSYKGMHLRKAVFILVLKEMLRNDSN
jgi:hypothetical protein